jgi:hypothetical protein
MTKRSLKTALSFNTTLSSEQKSGENEEEPTPGPTQATGLAPMIELHKQSVCHDNSIRKMIASFRSESVSSEVLTIPANRLVNMLEELYSIVEDPDILDTKIIESTFRKYLLGVQMASRGETNANSIWRTASEIETIKEFSFLPKMFKDSGNEHISTSIGKLKSFSPYSKYERDSKEKFKGKCFNCRKPGHRGDQCHDKNKPSSKYFVPKNQNNLLL